MRLQTQPWASGCARCASPPRRTPAGGACSLVVTLGSSKRAFRVLSEYFSTRKGPFEAKTGLKWRSPLCTRGKFNAMWDNLLAPLKPDPSRPRGHGLFRPHGFPVVAPSSNGPLHPGYPDRGTGDQLGPPPLLYCAGRRVSHGGGQLADLTISLANFGERARTPGFSWCSDLRRGRRRRWIAWPRFGPTMSKYVSHATYMNNP